MSQNELLSAESLALVDQELAKYPADRRASGLMAALRITQDEHGFLNPARIEYVAKLIGVPAIRAYEVATFYSMYEHQSMGEHTIKVCTNISCMLRGSDEIVTHLQNRLGIKLGEVTEDGQVGLKEVECLGACAGAPMLQMNKDYIENLTPEKIDSFLAEIGREDT